MILPSTSQRKEQASGGTYVRFLPLFLHFCLYFLPFVFFLFPPVWREALSPLMLKASFSSCAKQGHIPFSLVKNLKYFHVLPFYWVLLISMEHVQATHILKIKFHWIFSWTPALPPRVSHCHSQAHVSSEMSTVGFLPFLIFHSLWICSRLASSSVMLFSLALRRITMSAHLRRQRSLRILMLLDFFPAALGTVDYSFLLTCWVLSFSDLALPRYTSYLSDSSFSASPPSLPFK